MNRLAKYTMFTRMYILMLTDLDILEYQLLIITIYIKLTYMYVTYIHVSVVYNKTSQVYIMYT